MSYCFFSKCAAIGCLLKYLFSTDGLITFLIITFFFLFPVTGDLSASRGWCIKSLVRNLMNNWSLPQRQRLPSFPRGARSQADVPFSAIFHPMLLFPVSWAHQEAQPGCRPQSHRRSQNGGLRAMAASLPIEIYVLCLPFLKRAFFAVCSAASGPAEGEPWLLGIHGNAQLRM